MRPTTFQGAYPQRDDGEFEDGFLAGSIGQIRRLGGVLRRSHRRFVRDVNGLSGWAARLDSDGLSREAREMGVRLRREGLLDDLVARTFSLVREAADRTLGKRHFDVQLIGGRVLVGGMVAEMETGEGKTLTATLAAATAALAGIPVHVITVNDYLASRDASWMKPVYEALGLTVGTIVHGLSPHERRVAYASNITYCTNKEVAFDYLKDRIVLGRDGDRTRLHAERLFSDRPRMSQLLMRGLHFAIVDEADSVLVDEARTPLIISGADTGDSTQRETFETAMSIASTMIEGRDFEIDRAKGQVEILDPGEEQLEEFGQHLGGVWARRRWRTEIMTQAVTAQHLYHDGKQYLIRDGKIQIIDEFTGRVMGDRSWERGLHQLIEVKEGCAMSQRTDPLARISYQRFFRRYLKLAGMTGTAREVAAELRSVYGLSTTRIPTNRPCRRERWPDQIHATEDEKWTAVVARIVEMHQKGRPVLVGTRSVAASEHLSKLLEARGLPHKLLNARQDRDEALIVAEAGQRGRITVATNMAGRGTDIQLDPEVQALGGLHVIATELHEARRIDRQLFGRAARQGDAGSGEAIVSLADDLPRRYARGPWKAFGKTVAQHPGLFPARVKAFNVRRAQRSAERLHRRIRRDLLRVDTQLDSTLAFSGRSE